ncbi:MAG: BLUF domain-containing protein [Anaerolineae bacterium]
MKQTVINRGEESDIILITVVYGSKTDHPMSADELLTMLEQTRQYNKANGITGILLYKNCRFLQVIEGEKDSVEQLFETIKEDKRHSCIITYLKKEIGEREFGEWQMGFCDLELEKYQHIEGLTNFLDQSNQTERYTGDPSEVYMLLKNFRQYLR